MARPSTQKSTAGYVQVNAGPVLLEGNLNIPENAQGIVLFAHGSGSSRQSPRNRYVAGVLQEAGLATLLIDLLTQQEEAIDMYTMHLRFDIGLLADRLMGITLWIEQEPRTRTLRIGYFGASTGAGAALMAAANQGERIGAIVSRGGRPDLADQALVLVRAPTLLIVGENDPQVLVLNQQALDVLGAEEKMLVTIPNATHLFEEPGTLEEVARIAKDWFAAHLIH